MFFMNRLKEKIMNSPPVFKQDPGEAFCIAALFFVQESVQAADAQPAGKTKTGPGQLTPVEKYHQRHRKSQWTSSPREEIRRCDNVSDRQGSVNFPVQGHKSQTK